MNKYNVLAVNGVNSGNANRLEALAEGTNINLTYTEMNGSKALDSFKSNQPDLVLIETDADSDQSELNIANEFHQANENTPVLFLTKDPLKLKSGSRKDSYFQFPVTKHDFSKTVTQTILNYRKKNHADAGIKEAPYQRNEQNHSFFVKIGNKLKRVETGKICYIEVEEKYCSVNINNRQIHVKIALKDFLKKLPDSKFVRTHRNFVVNTDFVQSVNLGSNTVVMDDREIPFSRTYKEELMNQLNLI